MVGLPERIARRRVLLPLLILLALPAHGLAASPPNLVNLQGYLRTNAGTGLDGNVALTVRFYAAETGGSALHAESLPSVTVSNGRFKVQLGSGTALPSDLFTSRSAVWVGISVDGGAELPRRRLASAPFALSSERAQTAAAADTAAVAEDLTCTGCVGTADIADANVTPAKLSAAVSDTFVDAAGDTMSGRLTANAGVDFSRQQALNLRFHTAATAPFACNGDNFGLIYANSADKKLYYCSSSEWIPLTSGLAGADEDGDGVPNTGDNCFSVANADQNDTDADGAGDACDTDDDGDGVLDVSDNCPRSSNADQTDTDSDGAGDACDTDDDGDGVLDVSDNCPLVANADQVDLDGDGHGNACDTDDDGDGVVDGSDCQPLNAGVYPGATEVCGGVDEDCDGQTDEGTNLSGCVVYYKDADGDAYGLTSDSQCLCAADTANDYDATAGADCDDSSSARNPGATEICGGIDEDCDGQTDEGVACAADGTSVGQPGRDCAQIKADHPSSADGVYWIQPYGESTPFQAFCDMTHDGGGWTLAMKIDGTKQTFAYSSSHWTSTGAFNASSPALDENEAKLKSYSTVSFDAVRVGMKISGTTRWLDLAVVHGSLHELIAGGAYTATSAGRAAWLALPGSGSIQPNCNKEGFNLPDGNYTKARIGIHGNNEANCATPDSIVGFGTNHPSVPVVGNYAVHNPTPAEDPDVAAFGYVMVRRTIVAGRALGHQDNPAPSCAAIKADHPSSADGTYWLRPGGTQTAFQARCDMTTSSGGWTQLARYDTELKNADLDFQVSQAVTASGGTDVATPPNLGDDNTWGHVDFDLFDPDGADLRMECRRANSGAYFSTSPTLFSDWSNGDRGTYGAASWGYVMSGTTTNQARYNYFICGESQGTFGQRGLAVCSGPGGNSTRYGNHVVSLNTDHLRSGEVAVGCNGLGARKVVQDPAVETAYGEVHVWHRVTVPALPVAPVGTDPDGDGWYGDADNCPSDANADQLDTDGDGAGDACDTDDDGDGSLDGADCAPLDASRYPGATESCNGVDDDCDGTTDEACVHDLLIEYRQPTDQAMDAEIRITNQSSQTIPAGWTLMLHINNTWTGQIANRTPWRGTGVAGVRARRGANNDQIEFNGDSRSLAPGERITLVPVAVGDGHWFLYTAFVKNKPVYAPLSWSGAAHVTSWRQTVWSPSWVSFTNQFSSSAQNGQF